MPSCTGNWDNSPLEYDASYQRKLAQERASRPLTPATVQVSLPLPLAMEVNAGRMSLEQALSAAKNY